MKIKALAISSVVVAVVIFTVVLVKEEYFPPSVFDYEASYEEAVLTVEQQEKATPATFLNVNGTFRGNLIGQWVVEGNISSKATVVNYKDAVITMNFYSKTETLLGSEQFVVYEYLQPGSSKQFKIKTEGYKGAVIIGLEVADATAI